MKKTNSVVIIFLACIIMAVSLFSCGKSSTENKLMGRWSRVNIDNFSDTTRVEDWEFLGSSQIRIHYSPVTSTDTNYVEGTFLMDSYRNFTVSGSGGAGWPLDANGKWRIVKLKKGSLIIVRDEGGHGLTFKEFRQI